MKLLTLNPDGVQKLIEDMEREVQDIYKSAMQLVWYMRGGVQFTDVMNMGETQRNIIHGVIKDNLETTKNSGLPFF